MKLQPVVMREDQTIQCCICLRMKPEVWADLEGKAFKDYYCWQCIEERSVDIQQETP